jgi:2-oxoglutarate ferredoxin oxidoreductase subunit alpha
VQSNVKTAEAGYAYAQENFKSAFPLRMKPRSTKAKRMIIKGNDAISLGAIKAGCKFYAAYPMTPASSMRMKSTLFLS